MSSLITVRLYNEDWTPKTGATPLLWAIKQSDRSLVIDSESMEEVGQWFYQYNFTTYERNELYFFFIDNEQYDNINQLDSYWNKGSWGSSSVIINTEQLAKDVWGIKEWDVKKGTIWEHLFSLKNMSLEEVNIKIDDIFLQLFGRSNELELGIKEAILGIKIPKQIKSEEITKPIENMINNSIIEYGTLIKDWLSKIKETLDEKSDYDDTELRGDITKLLEEVEELDEKIEWVKTLEFKIDTSNTNNDKNKEEIFWSMDSIWSELKEINRKMAILFTRLNSK